MLRSVPPALPQRESGAILEEAVDACGEEFPLFGAAFEFGAACGGDSIRFAFPAFADNFFPAFEPALLFHFGEQGIEPPEGGMSYPVRDIGEFLTDTIAVHGFSVMKQRENQHLGVPLDHFRINTLFHALDISHSDISTSMQLNGFFQPLENSCLFVKFVGQNIPNLGNVSSYPRLSCLSCVALRKVWVSIQPVSP